MKAGPPHEPSPGDRMEASDPLWRLLAQAPRPEPDAWFAARTMARCRHEGLGGGEFSWVGAFYRLWRWALGGGVALSVTMALVMSQVQTEKADKQQNVQEAFQIMASIDTDSDSSSPSSWQDSSL